MKPASNSFHHTYHTYRILSDKKEEQDPELPNTNQLEASTQTTPDCSKDEDEVSKGLIKKSETENILVAVLRSGVSDNTLQTVLANDLFKRLVTLKRFDPNNSR